MGQGICQHWNIKSGKSIFIIVDKPIEDCVLLQQPISHEHNILLNKICKEIGLDSKLLYVTNILKCSGKPLKDNYEECSGNLREELTTLNPVATIVCGSLTIKYWKKFINKPCVEIPSLHSLFAGRTGINQMRATLKAIKDTYIG